MEFYLVWPNFWAEFTLNDIKVEEYDTSKLPQHYLL